MGFAKKASMPFTRAVSRLCTPKHAISRGRETNNKGKQEYLFQAGPRQCIHQLVSPAALLSFPCSETLNHLKAIHLRH